MARQSYPIQADPDFQRLSPEEQERILASMETEDQLGVDFSIPALGYEASKSPSLYNLMSGGEAASLNPLESHLAAEASGYTSIPAGASIPEGFTAVGSAPGGGTLIGPSSVAAPTPAYAQFGVGHAAAGAAGAAALYDVIKNKKHGTEGAIQGGLGGAGLAYAAMPLLASSGIGLPVALAGGALLGGGVGYFGNFGDKDRYKTEYKRAQALRDKGINWQYNANEPTSGRSKAELIAEEQAKIDAGGYGNTKFAASRNEADLLGKDISGYAAFAEKYGEKYANASQSAKDAIADEYLKAKAVREHHGTIDITSSPDLDKQAEQILGAPPTAEAKSSSPTGGDEKKKEEKKKKKGPGLADLKFPDLTQPTDMGFRQGKLPGVYEALLTKGPRIF